MSTDPTPVTDPALTPELIAAIDALRERANVLAQLSVRLIALADNIEDDNCPFPLRAFVETIGRSGAADSTGMTYDCIVSNAVIMVNIAVLREALRAVESARRKATT